MKKRVLTMLFLAGVIMIMSGCGESANRTDGPADDEKEQKEDKEVYSVLNEGSEAPDFTADVSGGGTFSLSEQKGKVVLLNFWATWCGPCVGEMPAFQKLYEEYGDEIGILAVNIAEERSTVDAFIADKGYTFPIAYDENGEISSMYPEEGIPYTLVIDADGKVKTTFVGAASADEQYLKYKDALKEAFSEAPQI